jgi:hypothetical protein
MLPSNCRKAAGSVLVALLVLAPGPLFSADAGFEERAQKLDQSIQALKKEVLDFNTEGQRIEDEILYPPHARLSVYLAVKVPGLLLKEVSVSLDNGPAQSFTYSDRDAKSLLAERHVQRILRANIGPGAHRIRLTYSGQMANAKADAPAVGDSYEAVFDKDTRETSLELVIARPNRLARAGISMKQWKAKK